MGNRFGLTVVRYMLIWDVRLAMLSIALDVPVLDYVIYHRHVSFQY